MPRSLPRFTVTVLLVLAACGAPADTFRTVAALEARAEGAPTDTANRGYLPEVLRIDRVGTSGPAGNGATLTSVADLAAGTLAISGGSHNAYDPAAGRYLGANATGNVALRDILSVVLPAGFYADTLELVIPTRLTGSIATVGPASGLNFVTGLLRWDLTLWNMTQGGPGTVLSGDTGFVTRTSSISVDAPLALVAQVVPGGTTLTTATLFEFQLDAQLWVIRNDSFSTAAPNSVVLDFANTLRFLRVETPFGLPFDSASGVFLSAVPLPGAALLLAPAALMLLGRRRTVRPGRTRQRL